MHLWKSVVHRFKKMIRDVVSNASAATAHPKPADPIHYRSHFDHIPQNKGLQLNTYSYIVELSECDHFKTIGSVREGTFVPIRD